MITVQVVRTVQWGRPDVDRELQVIATNQNIPGPTSNMSACSRRVNGDSPAFYCASVHVLRRSRTPRSLAAAADRPPAESSAQPDARFGRAVDKSEKWPSPRHAPLGTTWHGFPNKRRSTGTNGGDVGQEDAEILNKTPRAVESLRLGVRGSWVRIPPSRPTRTALIAPRGQGRCNFMCKMRSD